MVMNNELELLVKLLPYVGTFLLFIVGLVWSVLKYFAVKYFKKIEKIPENINETFEKYEKKLNELESKVDKIEVTNVQANGLSEKYSEMVAQILNIKHNIDMMSQDFENKLTTQDNKINYLITNLLDKINSMAKDNEKFREENNEKNSQLIELLLKLNNSKGERIEH
jgi:dGTP triphosphohydrolase